MGDRIAIYISQIVLEGQEGYQTVNCSACPLEKPHIFIYGSMMKIVDVGSVNVYPRRDGVFMALEAINLF